MDLQYKISGKRIRTPGMNCRADPQTGILTDEYMSNTNERIHRCVRVRLELEGLDLDDRGLYKATALQRKGLWRRVQTRSKIEDPIPWDATWGPGTPAPTVSNFVCVTSLAYLTMKIGCTGRSSLGVGVQRSRRRNSARANHG